MGRFDRGNFDSIRVMVLENRSFTVVLAIVFHLALDYSMNLFLFQWFMIVGLLSFMTLDSIPLKYFSRWLNSSEKVRLV